MSTASFFHPCNPFWGETGSDILQLKEEVSALSHEVAALRDYVEGKRGEAVCVVPQNQGLDPEERFLKLENDVAKLTEILGHFAQIQKTPANDGTDERSYVNPKEQMFHETQFVMGSSVEKQGPLAEVETEEWADMDVKKEMFLEAAPTVSPAEDHHQERGVSLASADRRSSRQSVQRMFSSVTTVPTEYHFTESVWSASAWIGQAPVVESCILSTVLLVNVLVQLYFSVVVIENMGSYSDVSLADDDLEGFLAWRTGTAHHMAHYDETTNTSLATRVCDSYPGTITAFDQMQSQRLVCTRATAAPMTLRLRDRDWPCSP